MCLDVVVLEVMFKQISQMTAVVKTVPIFDSITSYCYNCIINQFYCYILLIMNFIITLPHFTKKNKILLLIWKSCSIGFHMQNCCKF